MEIKNNQKSKLHMQKIGDGTQTIQNLIKYFVRVIVMQPILYEV